MEPGLQSSMPMWQTNSEINLAPFINCNADSELNKTANHTHTCSKEYSSFETSKINTKLATTWQDARCSNSTTAQKSFEIVKADSLCPSAKTLMTLCRLQWYRYSLESTNCFYSDPHRTVTAQNLFAYHSHRRRQPTTIQLNTKS